MKIAIVDDEEKWISQIEKRVRQYASDSELDIYMSGSAFLETKDSYDIIFMDIEIGKENGFQVAERYKKMYPDVIVIILTTHSELSRQGYRIEAFRYIDKLHMEEVEEAVVSAKKRLHQEKYVDLLVETGRQRLRYRDILYFEAQGHEVMTVTYKGTLACRNRMEELAGLLETEGFYLVHRSYLVNMEYVSDCTMKDVMIQNGSVVNMSRRKYKDFKQSLFDWRIERGFG